MKQGSIVYALLLVAGSGSVSAWDGYSYQCKNGTNARSIDVVYLQRESAIPCEVNYTKEGQQETLWTANYTEGYCEAKAAEFSKRQDEWGWSCQRVEELTPVKAETVESNQTTEPELSDYE